MNELSIFHFLFTVYYEVKQQLFICWLSKRKKNTETAICRCSTRQVLLKISQNS